MSPLKSDDSAFPGKGALHTPVDDFIHQQISGAYCKLELIPSAGGFHLRNAPVLAPLFFMLESCWSEGILLSSFHLKGILFFTSPRHIQSSALLQKG